jgi:NitT/TauT family transport system permease protein
VRGFLSPFSQPIISEIVASNLGVGYLMIAASSRFDVALGFADLMATAAMGVVLYDLFTVMEQRFTGWAYRNSGNDNSAGK